MTHEESNATRRQELYQLLGDLPDRDRPISVISQTRREHPRYELEEIVLDLNGIEHVPTFFVHPKEGSGPWLAVLYNHAHGGDYALGKDELLKGRPALQPPPYAEELTRLGYAALCFDAWAFGRRATISEGDLFKLMLWRGQMLWGMLLYDSIRAVVTLRRAMTSTPGASPHSGCPWAPR